MSVQGTNGRAETQMLYSVSTSVSGGRMVTIDSIILFGGECESLNTQGASWRMGKKRNISY